MPDRYAIIARGAQGDVCAIVTDPELNPQTTFAISAEADIDETRHLLGNIIASDILPLGFDAIYTAASLMAKLDADEREGYDFTFFDLGVLTTIFAQGFSAVQPTKSILKYLLPNLDLEKSYDATELAGIYLEALKALIKRLELSATNFLDDPRDQATSYSALDSFKLVEENRRREEDDKKFVKNINSSTIKHFLFFDTECSNCMEGCGKICEFGYIITDTNFKPLEQREYIINPGRGYINDFHLADRSGQIRIHLTYEANNYRTYRLQPELDKFIPTLDRLLRSPETLIFGFAISQDLRYVDYGFQRYLAQTRIDTPDIAAIDVQTMYTKYNDNQVISLDKAAAEYGRTDGSIRYHRAMDDAIATMQAYKNICEHLNRTPFEMLEEMGTASLVTMRDIIDPQTPYRFDEFQRDLAKEVAARFRRKHQEEAKIYPMMAYIDTLANNPENREKLKSKEYAGRRIYLTLEAVKAIKDIAPVLDAVARKGYVITSRAQRSDISIRLTRPAGKEDSRAILTLEELLND